MRINGERTAAKITCPAASRKDARERTGGDNAYRTGAAVIDEHSGRHGGKEWQRPEGSGTNNRRRA